MKINPTKNYIRKINFTEGNISKFTTTKTWNHLNLLTEAQDSFSFFYYHYHYLLYYTSENMFPEKYVEIKYKNRHTWMPNSLKNLEINYHTIYN